MKYPQFENIDTGLVDVDKNPIHNGDILIPGEQQKFTGKPPDKDITRLNVPYRVLYQDGGFKLKRIDGGKRSKVKRLFNLLVWTNGLRVCGINK